ncbi:hypothetical protein NCCP2495_05160 [Dietzia sp. NCCP-2495]|uniref:hypothetical protein n=1 Tax=Dietzia sp. NCCP-2495 TaxID=2934675 RepID=UPI00222F9F77|nr:hypothetical protein [Dietzia sp. NCCP-2495]GLB62638.1 hypothetical protein NCCP2495_05160 [Dietzia sp. NCCP-2495]
MTSQKTVHSIAADSLSTQYGPPIHARAVTALTVTTGALMAFYLLARPYGDAGGAETAAAADAFASPMWIWSHLAGATALVLLAALWALASTGAIRWAALAGVAMVLPYYGAETFALHAIGIRALSDPAALALVPAIRNDPAALPLFGLGLIALAVAGIAAALQKMRTQNDGPGRGRLAWALLPLAVVAALFLPQFFLPAPGRITYGLLFAAAAAVAAYAIRGGAGPSQRMPSGPSRSAAGGSTG